MCTLPKENMYELIKAVGLIIFFAVLTYLMNKGNDELKKNKREKVRLLVEESAKEKESILATRKTQCAKEDPLRRYKASVTWLCRYMAECQKMVEHMEKGKAVDPLRLKFSLSMVRQYKAYVLRDKKTLGFDEDMSAFGVEQKFRGFELMKGRLLKDEKADETCVQDVARKWVKGFPETYDAWHFEIGTLLICLDQPLTDAYYPKEWQMRWKKKTA